MLESIAGIAHSRSKVKTCLELLKEKFVVYTLRLYFVGRDLYLFETCIQQVCWQFQHENGIKKWCEGDIFLIHIANTLAQQIVVKEHRLTIAVLTMNAFTI